MTRKLGPTMPLYVDDFLGGTLSFSATEVGAYFLLLAHQWAEGAIDDDERSISLVARSEYQTLGKVLRKFQKGDDGRLRNPRLDQIRQERVEYVRSRADNAAKGWRRKHEEQPMQPVCTAYAEHTTMHTGSSPSPSPIRENIYNGEPDKEWTLQEFQTAAGGVGIKAEDVEACFHHYAAVGFVDAAGRKIRSIKSLLAKWAAAQPSRGRAQKFDTSHVETVL